MIKRSDVMPWVGGLAAYMLLITASPHLAYLLRWPTRLGTRGLLTYVVCSALSKFVIRYYGLPAAQRFAERQQRERELLAARLGREPTDEEFVAHLYPGNS